MGHFDGLGGMRGQLFAGGFKSWCKRRAQGNAPCLSRQARTYNNSHLGTWPAGAYLMVIFSSGTR